MAESTKQVMLLKVTVPLEDCLDRVFQRKLAKLTEQKQDLISEDDLAEFKFFK